MRLNNIGDQLMLDSLIEEDEVPCLYDEEKCTQNTNVNTTPMFDIRSINTYSNIMHIIKLTYNMTQLIQKRSDWRASMCLRLRMRVHGYCDYKSINLTYSVCSPLF